MEFLHFGTRQPDRIPAGYLLRYHRSYISELSLRDIAKCAGLNQGYLRNIERGGSNFPLPRLASISAAYGLSTGIVSRAFGYEQSELEASGIAINEPTEPEAFLYELLSGPEDLDNAEVAAEIINNMMAKYGYIVE